MHKRTILLKYLKIWLDIDIDLKKIISDYQNNNVKRLNVNDNNITAKTLIF